MYYKVSYNSRFGNNGTYYNQYINLTMSREEYLKMNRSIAVYKLNLSKGDYQYLYLDTFHKGKNYTTNSQLKWLKKYFDTNDKRIKEDRNTLVNINII